jgi:hypothetical protein
MSEEYSVGYSEGYQTGRNEAIDELEQEHRLLRARNDRLEAEANTAQPAPVQEHVATLIEHYAFTDGIVRFDGVENMEQLPVGTKFYTTPPAAQRQWVGLTDEEIFSVLGNLQRKYNGPPTEDSRVVFALAIEAKLKERNQ